MTVQIYLQILLSPVFNMKHSFIRCCC